MLATSLLPRFSRAAAAGIFCICPLTALANVDRTSSEGIARSADTCTSSVMPPLAFEIDNPQLPGGSRIEATWHLCVINGGQPRGAALASIVEADAEAASNFALGKWTFKSSNETTDNPTFGRVGATAISGDFNGDGQTELGLFVDGRWYLDMNGNRTWDQGDLCVRLGQAGDLPVAGDWDGDGKTDIGIFGAPQAGDEHALATEAGLPDADNTTRSGRKNGDHVLQFGAPGDRIVAGDFNGDGIDTVAIFRNGHWVIDVDGDGRFTSRDAAFDYGSADALPVAGDFNGDGVDEIGVYARGVWHLDTNGDRKLDDKDTRLELGTAATLPVVGDFDGSGRDLPAVYQPLAVSHASR